MRWMCNRLVANQRPSDIVEKLSAHIQRFTPEGVEIVVSPISGSAEPSLILDNSPVLCAAEGMGGHPIHMRIGATVPILGMLNGLLGIEVVSLGFSCLNDNIHAPNESQDLALYRAGSKVYGAFFNHVSHVGI